MKKKLKRLPRRGMFCFFKKQINTKQRFENLIGKILKGQNNCYILSEDTSYGKVTGNAYTVIHGMESTVGTVKTVSLFYQAKTGKITVTFYKGPLQRTKNDTAVVKRQTLKLIGARASMVKTNIINWFQKEKHPDIRDEFKVCIIFKKDTLDYKEAFVRETVGSTLAHQVVNDIWQNVIKNDAKEMQNLYRSYKSGVHLANDAILCCVINTQTGKEIPDIGKMMEGELGNQIFEKLRTYPKPIQQKTPNYWEDLKGIIFSIKNWLTKNMVPIPGRVQ